MSPEIRDPREAPVESAAEYILRSPSKYQVVWQELTGNALRRHDSSLMKKEDVRNSNGSNAFGTTRKPCCDNP